jgi:hypothetical protein
MDEVTSLTSLGALILNGNTTDEYSRLSITLISLVGNMLDYRTFTISNADNNISSICKLDQLQQLNTLGMQIKTTYA